MQALYVASQGRMLFTTFPALVGPVAETFGLRVYPLPFDMPKAPLSVVTRATRHDPFSHWLHTAATEVIHSALRGSHHPGQEDS